MSKHLSQEPNQPQNQHDHMRRALVQLRWIIPITPEEVELAEKSMDASGPSILPESLACPNTVLNSSLPELVTNHDEPSSDIDASAAANLARAAREGASVSADIEEHMRADRDDAERKADN